MPCAIGKIRHHSILGLARGFEYSSCLLPSYKIMGNNKISKHMDDSPLNTQLSFSKGSK